MAVTPYTLPPPVFVTVLNVLLLVDTNVIAPNTAPDPNVVLPNFALEIPLPSVTTCTGVISLGLALLPLLLPNMDPADTYWILL